MRSLFLFMLLSVGPAFSQFGIPTQLPKESNDAEVRNIVGQYCRLDYQGARLSDQGYGRS